MNRPFSYPFRSCKKCTQILEIIIYYCLVTCSLGYPPNLRKIFQASEVPKLCLLCPEAGRLP